jgi:hypothetical protein
MTPTIAGAAITRVRSRRMAIAATSPRGSEVSTWATLIAMKEAAERNMPMSFAPVDVANEFVEGALRRPLSGEAALALLAPHDL